MKPNPNLWSVSIVDKQSGVRITDVLICAASAATATNKAKRWIKRSPWHRCGVRIDGVHHEGVIDAF